MVHLRFLCLFCEHTDHLIACPARISVFLLTSVKFSVEAVLKRVDEAVETLADFLNTSVFSVNGPD